MCLVLGFRFHNDSFKFEKGDIRLENGLIKEISENILPYDNEEIIEVDGKKVIPGLIDIHTHGSRGFDTCDNIYDGFLAHNANLMKTCI